MSVHKDKKRGTWYVKYQKTTKRGFLTKSDAKEYEAKLKIGIVETNDKETHQFSYIAEEFLKAKKNDVSYSTYIKSKSIVDNQVIPYVVDKPIEFITELDCKKFKDKIIELKLATSHKNNILAHYKAIFKYARQYYKLSNNPTQFLTPIKKSFKEKLKIKEKEKDVWNYEEFERFIVCVEEKEYRELYIVLFFTGLRLGEALALNWDDLIDHKLSITKSMTKICEDAEFLIKDTKNISSIRDITLNDSLYKFLLVHLDEHKKKDKFTTKWFIFGGSSPLKRTNITRYKDKAIAKSGVNRITIHQFRHSHATNLINDGVNIVAVSRRLGHSDVSMTLKVYTHLFKKADDELIDNVEKCSHDVLTKL